ncbi:MAG: hypothetical protein FJW36_26215 [Acidobacteria bacterium]|nr:hypothetical protein [Acidobacteriota bacterium]
MLTNEITDILDRADVNKCIELLQPLSETERRSLYPTVATVAKALTWTYSPEEVPSSFDRHRAVGLALLGTATFSELKAIHRAGPWSWPHREVTTVLSRRRPSWLADWAQFALINNFRMWNIVREFVRQGWISPPQTENYILGMIYGREAKESVRAFLMTDSLLLESEFWKLFEHEGSGELSLAAFDKYCMPSNRWAEGIRDLADEKILDRSRLLNATLEALQRDFAPFRAGWFSRMHELLSPTPSERLLLAPIYFKLLLSRVPTTVSFAMKALTIVHKINAIDPSLVIKHLAPAFEATDKGTIIRALKVASDVYPQATSANKAQIAEIVSRALVHESPEIQTAIANFLREHHLDRIEPYLEVLAPSVLQLIGHKSKPIQSAAANSIPAQSVDTVVPIQNLAELIVEFSRVLENQGPPIDIERVIEAVPRLGLESDREDAAFKRQTNALASRAQKLLSRDTYSQPRAMLSHFALAWTLGIRHPQPPEVESAGGFLKWRLWCASEQVAQRLNQPLLSLFRSGRGGQRVGSELLPLNHAAILNSTEKSRRA